MVEGQNSVTMEKFTHLSTNELQEIWNRHDSYQYSGADFAAVKALLEGQGVTVAPETSSEDARLTGIGGWLVFPAIGMVINPFMNIFNIGVTAEVLSNAPTRFHAALNFEIMANVILLVFCVITAFLFFMRKEAAPKTMIALLSTSLVLVLIEAFIVYDISESVFEEVTLPELVRAILVAGVWIPYFLNSKRVRLTFTR